MTGGHAMRCPKCGSEAAEAELTEMLEALERAAELGFSRPALKAWVIPTFNKITATRR